MRSAFLMPMLATDECDQLEPWLRSLPQRNELIARMAFRGAFDPVRRNRAFMMRIVELTCALHLSGADLEHLREDAILFAAQLKRAAKTLADD